MIDDTYNANPLSVKAALDILAQQSGEKVLVLGDMKELGANAAQYHHELGADAQRLGINQLYTFGDLAAHAAQAFGPNAQHFSDQMALAAALQPTLHSQMVVLIKGSRSMRMERIVQALLATEKSAAEIE